jgi:hypothetical protein
MATFHFPKPSYFKIFVELSPSLLLALHIQSLCLVNCLLFNPSDLYS